MMKTLDPRRSAVSVPAEPATQSALRVFSVPQTLCACFSSSGPRLDAIPHALVAEIDAHGLHAQVGHHVAMRALQARPGRLGDVLVLHRGDLHAPAAGRAGHVVDQAGDAGTALGRGRAWSAVQAGAARQASWRRPAASSRGRRSRPAAASGSWRDLGVGRLGRGRRRQVPPAGSLGVVGPGSSFSGWVGTAPGCDAVEDFLVLVRAATSPPAFSGLTRDGVAGACTTSGSSPLPPALTSWLCAHHTTEPKLAMAAIETMTVRIWPRRRLTRMSSESRGGGGMESGSCATGRGRRIEPHGDRLVRSVDRWTVAGGGPADVHFSLSHLFDGCYAEDL